MSAAAEAAEALAAWRGDAPPRLVKDRENAVFAVTLSDGMRAALRLHRPGYQSADAIRSELAWTEGLAEAGLPVPRPVRTATGALLQELSSGRIASMVEWVGGVPLGASGLPLEGSAAEKRDRFHRIGALLARLHDATDRLPLPADFIRPAWDAEGLLGEAPLWGRFWDSPALTALERGVLLEARAEARRRLDAMAPGADIGLIHADLMRENILVDGDTLRLIDFDDSGYGFRLYEFGTLMLQNLDEPGAEELLAAAVEGYSLRRPVDAANIPLFVMLRCFASCGWAVPRLPEGSPAHRAYAERAVTRARGFLAAG